MESALVSHQQPVISLTFLSQDLKVIKLSISVIVFTNKLECLFLARLFTLSNIWECVWVKEPTLSACL
jgi:hypothetical protein